MKQVESTAKRHPTASQPTSKETAVRSRSAAKRARDRRRSLVWSLAILLVIGSGVVVAALIEHPASPDVISTSPARPDRDLRTAKIMNDTGNGCTQQILDNQTWHTSGSAQPCDPVLRDSNGIPVPIGTIHRLDAINKSFSGK